MVHYKLYYFVSRGLAEVSRQLFALADVKFDDIRIDKNKWPAVQKDMPFERVPVLDVDGVQIPQSLAIARYLARKFGFAGKTSEEEALVDAFADQFKEFYAEILPYYLISGGIIEGDAEKERVNSLIPARDKFLPLLLKYIKKSKSGYLVDSGLTYADLIIVDNATSLIKMYPDYANGYPDFEAYYERVCNVPAIRKHIDSRPETLI